MQNGFTPDAGGDFVPDPFGPIIPWAGGVCPVAPDTIVRLHFRGRSPYAGYAFNREMPEKYHASIWQHAPFLGRNDPEMDVIGYQVLNV